MRNQPGTPRWIVRRALGGVCLLSALGIVSAVSTSKGQPPASSDSKPAADRNRDGIEAIESLLEAKRTLLRIDESRAEQAKRWKAYYERMVKEGRVIADRLLAARDDILMMETHLAAERAELKVAEIHADFARRRVSRANQPTDGVELAREELDELAALVEARQALIHVQESRLEQAKRVEARYQKLFRAGMATEDLVIASRDDALLMESLLAWSRVELKQTEIRLKEARRVASPGGTAIDTTARKLADLEARLAISEMKSDVLQHEVGRLRRELPRETHGAR